MLNYFKFLRYIVFVVFVVSNSIITSAAVWNLSIVDGITGDAVANGISTYLIILGALGLVVIFTIIFSDLYGKDIFICRVWFELVWVVLFFMMELAGAASITTRNGQVCNSNGSGSSCVSTQVLQAFTWICAIFLLCYFIFLFVSVIMKYRDDATIWSRCVRKLIWQQSRKTATAPIPRFRNQSSVIAAPHPRRIIAIPEAVLSYRSGLSLDYEIEHYQPPALEVTEIGPSVPPIPLPLSSIPVSPTRILLQPPQKPSPAAFTSFYPSYVQSAFSPGLSPQVRKLPQTSSPSPPPLGDWPRRDVSSLPPRGKRKINPPAPYSFIMPTSAQQQHHQPTRSRPSGPRRRSNSGDYRPRNLDNT